MKAYSGFAGVYDAFMEDIPYDLWLQHTLELLEQREISAAESGAIIELGCGTGNFTQRLAEQGFHVLGIDLAKDMLAEAERKHQKLPAAVAGRMEYRCQDMTDFQVDLQAAAVVSVCDSMNYLVSGEQLYQAFCSAYAALKEQGAFVFDMKTAFFYGELLGENTFAETRPDCAYIWENFYDEEECTNEYDLIIFVKNETGTYERFEETHIQRAYEQEYIEALLARAGFQHIAAVDADSMGAVEAESERVYYVCTKGVNGRKECQN